MRTWLCLLLGALYFQIVEGSPFFDSGGIPNVWLKRISTSERSLVLNQSCPRPTFRKHWRINNLSVLTSGTVYSMSWTTTNLGFNPTR